MKLLKRIIIGNLLGMVLMVGAVIAIVGGSMVICGLSALAANN